MLTYLKGWPIFLASILAFFGWVALAIHNDGKEAERMANEAKKEAAIIKANEAALESLQNAILEKAKIQAKYADKTNNLEAALDASPDWRNLPIPDDVARRLKIQCDACEPASPARTPAQGYSNPTTRQNQNSGRYGQPNPGRRESNEAEKR